MHVARDNSNSQVKPEYPRSQKRWKNLRIFTMLMINVVIRVWNIFSTKSIQIWTHIRGVYNAMWTTWFWVVMNKGLLIAFFGLGAMRGQQKAGSVYARFGLIPLTSIINFITQILVLYAYYAFVDYNSYYFQCTTTCYKIRKASFGLAIISLIFSVIVIIDLIVESCKKPKPIPRKS